jgi:RNA polymerase sigma-70 factor (ECF subfamily)
MTEFPAQPRLLGGSVDGAPTIRGGLEHGRPGDLRALFEAERDGLFRFLWRLSGNANDAEDLLQETFLTAWRKQHEFEERGLAAGYLRRTAFRVFLNARRKLVRRGPPARPLEPEDGMDASHSTSHAVAESEAREHLRRHVRAALDALPAGTREVFVLFRFEGLACAEIAQIAGLSVDAVEGRIERATKLLATRLRPHTDDLPEC